MKSTGGPENHGGEDRIASLLDEELYGVALVHLNAFFEGYLQDEMEAEEAGHLEQYSADIGYHRALERARNQHADDDHGYELVDLDAVEGIDNEHHLFQVIGEIASVRRDYAHDIGAYAEQDHDGEAAYGHALYRELA